MNMQDKAMNTLVRVIDLDIESQMKLMHIRNQEEPVLITANEHLCWLNTLKHDDRRIVFALIDQDKQPIGIATVHAIDQLNKTAAWSLCVTESSGSGLAAAIAYSVVDFVFDTLRMDTLHCEVVEDNSAGIALHKAFLWREEGFRRACILKNGVRLGVHLFGLMREEWNAGKRAIQEQYSEVFKQFPVVVQWADAEKPIHPIDQIEAARAKNNLNWMSILRLALEKSPDTAKPIVSEIRRLDREISALTEQLTE
jgi:UDP-4-amino-4,6-dideoxy-N-acetyl-beta-L-altrosamine N-acetyltransferase